MAANGHRLLRLAYLLTGDRYAAEDVVQAVLGRALLSWRRIAAGNPDAYLRRAIYNERTSRWRRQRRENLVDSPVDMPTPDHAGTVVQRHALLNAVRHLSRRQRAALVLRYLEDLPDAEIATILGCSPATVRSSVARGLRSVRADLSIDLSEVT